MKHCASLTVPDIVFSKQSFCNSRQPQYSDNLGPEDLLPKNLSFNKILLQGPEVSSLTRLELRHPSERLSQSLQDSMPSTMNRTTQAGPSITDLPTDVIVGIFDQVNTTTRRPDFDDLSDSCVYSCTITRIDYTLLGRANPSINADTHTIGDP